MTDLQGWQKVAREIGDHHIGGWSLSVLKSGPEHAIGDWLPAEAAAKEILRLRERVAVLERSAGARDVALERDRHRTQWSDMHDDEHVWGMLAAQAAGLAYPARHSIVPDSWGLRAKHAADRRRQLVVAGALIAAEIDRLDRAAAKPADNGAGGA